MDQCQDFLQKFTTLSLQEKDTLGHNKSRLNKVSDNN